jgi:hypothetical protein
MVRTSLADELGLPRNECAPYFTYMDEIGVVPVYIRRIDRLTVGEAAFEDFEVFTLDDLPQTYFGQRIDGCLGVRTFRDLLLTIDYTHCQIVLDPHGEIPADDPHLIPIRLKGGRHFLTPVKIGDTTVEACIGTGYGGWVSVDAYHKSVQGIEWKSAGTIESDDLEVDSYGVLRQADPIRVGGIAVENPLVVGWARPYKIIECSEIKYIEIQHLDADVGGAFLKHFNLTIDQANVRVRLKPNSDQTLSMPTRYAMDLDRTWHADDPDEVRVNLDGRKPAARLRNTPLKPTDRVIKVNGVDVNTLNYDKIEKLIRRGYTVHLTVDRDGETIEVEVPVGWF